MSLNCIHALAAALVMLPSAGLTRTVIFADNCNDNTVTGWTFFDRNGPNEIANANWVETGGRLEQQTDNYDFPRDSEDEPYLGTIALAPGKVGGHYQITSTFISLEPGNGFQDQDIVFGYVDENNFFYVETIPDRVVIFQVVDSNRMLIDQGAVTFSHDPIVVTVEHESEIGRVAITYGDALPLEFTNPALIREGENSFGVAWNNDAFAIDDFSVSSISLEESPELKITSLDQDPETGGTSITWTSQAGVEYFVEKSDDLTTWNEVDDATGEAGTTTLVDLAPGASKAFYRVRSGQ